MINQFLKSKRTSLWGCNCKHYPQVEIMFCPYDLNYVYYFYSLFCIQLHYIVCFQSTKGKYKIRLYVKGPEVL